MKIVKPKPGDLVYGTGTKDLIYVMDKDLGVWFRKDDNIEAWMDMFSFLHGDIILEWA